MNLAAEYERLCEAPSDIYRHLPRFVSLVESLQAQHVIELGTRLGISTVAWLYALQSTGGRLTSVDLDEGPDLGEQPAWTFIQGSDLDPLVLRQLDMADIVFIDTSHLFDQTYAELATYRYLVRPGGVIVCHDTMLQRPENAPETPRFPVRTAIRQFCADEGFSWVEHPECFGLGIITI